MDQHSRAVRADELTTLSWFLDDQRATLVQKVSGLADGQQGQRLAPSPLTLGGLVKHLALVEDGWFVETFLGQPLPEPWASQAQFDDDPDWEFHTGATDPVDEPLDLYGRACARSRKIVADAGDLDALSVSESRRGEGRFSLRWIMVHMIEETARHNGHADLIRESIDGLTES
jgi:hypothetical protein